MMGSNPNAVPEQPKKSKVWIIVLVLGCVGLPVVVAVIGIIAAIAIPSLLRARVSANEAQNIGDIRAVISAQMAYQASSGGRFDPLNCLENPSSCISGYSGPVFLSPEAVQTERAGYRRTFEVGPGGLSFTYVVVPITPNTTGIRSFCGDSSGLICFTNGARPNTNAGQCLVDSTCTPLS
jgi:type IV pilus assembly protein PilA